MRTGAVLLLALSPWAVAAEPGPAAPRLVLGGEASFTIAPDDEGYFNESAYGHNVLRMARLDLLASLRLRPRWEVVADLRSENLDAPRVYALYLRLRPFAGRELDLQLGRIPPVFGTFPRRRYAQDNPLVSWPLPWQYLTTLRPDALPPDADHLLAIRGAGWYAPYPGYGFAAGVPEASAGLWDTGIEARYAEGPLALAVAVSQGSLSAPRFEDDNDGKQVSARAAWTPAPGVEVGASVSRGAFLARSLPLPPGRFEQRAFGLDAEFSRGRVVVRGELIGSEWDLPRQGDPPVDRPLRALGGYVEARWRFAPGWHVAGRLDALGFGDIEGRSGPEPWESPVRRVEAGLGFSPWRYVQLKTAWQRNRRDHGRVLSQDLVAMQAVLWF